MPDMQLPEEEVVPKCTTPGVPESCENHPRKLGYDDTTMVSPVRIFEVINSFGVRHLSLCPSIAWATA